MLDILRRVISARACAAAFSIATNLVALHLLSSEEYAAGAVTVAVSAVLLPILYQPFSKFILVSRKWRTVGRLFWASQPPTLVLIGLVVSLAALSGLPWLLCAAGAAFAVSQGWKEVCGETARAMGAIHKLQHLYIYDALTTALVTVVALSYSPTAESFLLSYAVSSVFWSLRLTPFSSLSKRKVSLKFLLPVYRYSSGLSVTTFLGSSTLAIGREAIRRASPPEIMGPVQFLLDIFQKAIALLASSVLTSVIPEARFRPISALIPVVVSIFSGILLVMAGLAAAVVSSGQSLFPGLNLVTPSFAVLCAVYVWANRYKNVALDFPLISSGKHTFALVPGATISLVAVWCLASLGLGLSLFMVASAAALTLGGLVSATLAWRFGLVERRSIWIQFLPVLAMFSFAVICARLWNA